MAMTIKNEDEIRKMAEAGEVVALVHARIEQAITRRGSIASRMPV